MMKAKTLLSILLVAPPSLGVSWAVESAPPETSAAKGQACSVQGVAPGGCVVTNPVPRSAIPDAGQLLERMRATFAALGSYADTGTMVIEDKPIGSTTIRERYTFSTRYVAPRRFHFDLRKGPTASAERFVIWCPGETFNSWWSATQVKEEYVKGKGANAFAMGELPTAGAALLIPPLLFPKAGLQGPLLVMTEPQYTGSEQFGGRLTHIITANVRVNHWGNSVRATSIWIDAETLMIRKVFEDTPTGLGGAVQRVTTTFEPQPGAKLDDAQFRFEPPRAPQS